jgi:peptidoglycan hydrolase-like protein with peptidoglycan-binding domain
MHQESKIVELRPVAAGPDPARDKPGIVPSIVPSELTEDLKWVLREIRGVEAIRSESGRLDQIGKRRAAGAWLTAGMIAIGALVCIAAENGHPFASIGHSGDVGAQRSVATNRSGDARAQLAAFDLLRAADAARVQQRLADLGFFVGTPNGTWGPRSRQALREFKSANGLPADDHWSAGIQSRLFALDAQRATPRAGVQPAEIAGAPQQAFVPSTEGFVGNWASDAAECRASGAGIHVGPGGAEGYGGTCSFGSVQREGSAWRVKAACSGSGTTWNANIKLAVSGDRLRWSSERGTAVYVRCGSHRDQMQAGRRPERGG